MMRQVLANLIERMAFFLICCGGVIVLIQALWITYGVFMRYVLNSPDGMVTEATALMLVPVAFLGLAFALSQDAYPKVTLLTEMLSPRLKVITDHINLIVMILIGIFFSLAAAEATMRAYKSGAASEILLWPKFYFWLPVSISLYVFTLMAISQLLNYKSSFKAEEEQV